MTTMALSMMMNLLLCKTSMHRKNFGFLYDLFAPVDLEELDESVSFAQFRFGKRDIRILKEVLQIPDMIRRSKIRTT